MKGNETLQAVSPIRWCSQQEFISVQLCQGTVRNGCVATKSLPPRAPESSHFRYDYSNYHFDVVTLLVGSESQCVQCVEMCCA